MMVSCYELIVLSLLIPLLKASMYDESFLNYFAVSTTSTLTVSSDVYKHGTTSLKWTWQKGDALKLDFDHEPVEKRALIHGGVKLWLYLVRNIPGGRMTLSFYTNLLAYFRRGLHGPECQFDISLDFRGWRGIWVAFDECRLRTPMFPLHRLVLRAPAGHDGEIYIDLLRIIRNKIRRQSRDEIVPPIRGRISLPNSFWQQTYRWSLSKPKTTVFNELELNDEQMEKLRDIRLIRSRLRNWLIESGKSSYDLTGYPRSTWFRLKAQIKRAREDFKTLNITRHEGFIRGPPLFSRNSEYGKQIIRSPELKFGFLMREVLLPLSLQHFFLTRKEEIRKIVVEELGKLNDPKLATRTTLRLVSYDKELLGVFLRVSKLGVRRLTRAKLRLTLRAVNRSRFQRVLLLLEYIMDQGWAAGSAIGSLDHEMNRSGKGFVTSLFLLAVPLRQAGLLPRLVNILKWYLEFGEVYQERYEYNGTTADRMRTLMLYRLVCVILMPEGTLQEALEKLRDMDALRNWHENALRVNPAMGGVIKPDYTGYHHKSFYTKDYVLPALLAASQVVYLLRGTRFELDAASRSNLRNAIHFMRILSAEYSVPNSVTNTDPNVARPELICLIPAFAYATLFEHRSRGGIPTPREMSAKALESFRAFLRLYDESDPRVRAYLLNGSDCAWTTSNMHTPGSLALVFALKRLARDFGIGAERSPAGNWAKNFAALAIHRRRDWAVTVKGFNNFVWGHEASHRGNHYGLYQSYGQLLIANSDRAMEAYDIDRGWDWTRLPGTTTLRVPLRELVLKRSRFYNPEELCGAVSLQGTSRWRNGGFVMNFKRPDYGAFRKAKTDSSTQFSFKKSVFFYDELLVCLGSDVSAKRETPVEVETTLFQNIGIIRGKIHSIEVNGFKIPVRPYPHSNRLIWRQRSTATLIDVNGNGYYVPNAGTQNLNVLLGNQSSYSDRNDARTHGYFATAWLNHGANPRGSSYEYAILVNTSSSKLRDFACRQGNFLGRGPPAYEVLRQDARAHVVKFNDSPRRGHATYAYSVFARSVPLPGPLRLVGDPCVVMAEDGGSASDRLIIGLSYPQMNFNTTHKWKTANDVKTEELFYIRSHVKRVWVLLRDKVQTTGYAVYVDGKRVDHEKAREHVRVRDIFPETNRGSMLYFINLLNGFTTEVHLHRIPVLSNEF